ncbi:MAG: hypothetical protein ACLFRD_11865, partial [Nitriliruptoraceae bacterium]
MMRWLLAVFTVVLLGLLTSPVLLLAAMADERSGGAPSATARADIPEAMLTLYQQAAEQRCRGLPWPVLAAVGKVESDHGRIGGTQLTPDGRFAPPIIGPALDGNNGLRRLP